MIDKEEYMVHVRINKTLYHRMNECTKISGMNKTDIVRAGILLFLKQTL